MGNIFFPAFGFKLVVTELIVILSQIYTQDSFFPCSIYQYKSTLSPQISKSFEKLNDWYRNRKQNVLDKLESLIASYMHLKWNSLMIPWHYMLKFPLIEIHVIWWICLAWKSWTSINPYLLIYTRPCTECGSQANFTVKSENGCYSWENDSIYYIRVSKSTALSMGALGKLSLQGLNDSLR